MDSTNAGATKNTLEQSASVLNPHEKGTFLQEICQRIMTFHDKSSQWVAVLSMWEIMNNKFEHAQINSRTDELFGLESESDRMILVMKWVDESGFLEEFCIDKSTKPSC